jgi:hypothetical protein
LLSKISSESVGVSLEANRLYDAVNCLLSWMVCISFFKPPDIGVNICDLCSYGSMYDSIFLGYDYNIFLHICFDVPVVYVSLKSR